MQAKPQGAAALAVRNEEAVIRCRRGNGGGERVPQASARHARDMSQERAHG